MSPVVAVSFIVPLFNCLPYTQAMLASLQATVPAGLAHEIIFIDDGSTDGTREWLSTRPAPIRVLLNERNLGYAIANNRAAAIAEGELLVLLNNDLVLQRHWLEPMLDAHQRLGTRAGVVGNVQRDARTRAIDHAGILIDHNGKPEHARELPPLWLRWRDPVRKMPAVTGACLLIARALWEELGGFDETFVNGGEDVDLCYRARAAGRDTVVALRSVIRHHVSSSIGRKLRDEENSRRLLARWRREFLADATRTWCRHYVRGAFLEPHSGEYPLVGRAFLHAAGFTATPPPEAIASLEAAHAREFARWEHMFRPRETPASAHS